MVSVSCEGDMERHPINAFTSLEWAWERSGE